MVDLSPYLDDIALEDLRSNPFQQGEDDGDHPIQDQAQLGTPAHKVQALVQKAIN